MHYIIKALLFILIINVNSADASIFQRHKKWTVKVYTVQGKVVKGTFLRSDSDSLWVLVNGNQSLINFTFSAAAEQLYKIKFRRKGSPGKGFALGLVTGVSLGIFIGSKTIEDNPNSNQKQEAMTQDAWILGAIFGATGGILGTSYTEKYFIGGQRNQYLKFREKFGDYALE